jgi:hypothetical protein
MVVGKVGAGMESASTEEEEEGFSRVEVGRGAFLR